MLKQNESINSLCNVFFMTTQGNDCYALRYHLLRAIYNIAGKEFPGGINEDELYNLQYNYEHYSSKSGSVNKLIIMDQNDKEITAKELESRLQKLLNKMFFLLSEVLKEYGYVGGLGFK